MGLFSTLKKAVGIAEMKADEALDESLNPVDKAKLNIKNKKAKLTDAKKNLTKVREVFYTEKNKLTKFEDDLVDLEDKKAEIIVAMENFKKKGLDSNAIKAKVAKPFAQIVENIEQMNSNISAQAPIVAQHEASVNKFEDIIAVFEKELKADEHEVKILESQYNIADTTSAIADAMNELNADGSADDIAKLRARKDAKQAKADALMAGVLASQDVGDSIENLLKESEGTSATSELDALLGLSETPALGSPEDELEALILKQA